MSERNRRWVIGANPLGRALETSDFRRDDQSRPAPGLGEALIKVRCLSMDPALKSYMENISTYARPTNIGDVMPGEAIGEVVASNCPDLVVGARVRGDLGWQDFAVVKHGQVELVHAEISDTAALGVLGTTGKTAYCGLVGVGQPKPGDVLVVSGAAGATGTVVGQIGKIAGCRVIGIAGGAAKCERLIEDLGFDAAIDYKSEKVRSRLRALAPEGIDVMFDNVGGEVLNDCLARLAPGARVVICGAISRYNADPRNPGQMPEGPRNYFNLVHAHARMEGFILHHYAAMHEEAQKRLTRWVGGGQIKESADVVEGFERAPEALLRVFSGANLGKQLVRL
jgi:hypothetical protein